LEKDNGEVPWILAYCRAYAAPNRITAEELVPAVTGEHAPEPQGKGYDWTALGQACSDLEGTLSPLTAAAASPPANYAPMTDRTAKYVTTLSSFVRLCQEAAANEDSDSMNRLAPVLVDLADQGQVIDGIMSNATD
jgi:hypothetical protein